MRFFLIDRIEEICYGKYITGIKSISLSDDTFNEHFPGYPVFPGTLIIEAVAQLSGSLFELTLEHSNKPIKRSVLSIVNHFKFKKPVYPGDRLILRVDIKKLEEDYGVVKTSIEVEGDVYCHGELTFMFVEIDNPELHKARNKLYKIWMRSANQIS
jgi:3-hydroxyacyl-[acyl-carrier-protein] dehydratase